jgi:hypothetical protein
MQLRKHIDASLTDGDLGSPIRPNGTKNEEALNDLRAMTFLNYFNHI